MKVVKPVVKSTGGPRRPAPGAGNSGAGSSYLLVEAAATAAETGTMLTFLVWLLLFIVCWPLALVALVLYPLVWLLLLPFRLLGIAVGGVLALVRGVVFLPARLLGAVNWTVKWFDAGGRKGVEAVAAELAELLVRGLLAPGVELALPAPEPES